MPDILIVDDNLADQQLAIHALRQRHDWVVETAIDGLNALDLLSSSPFLAVVSDIRMPRIDGLALLNTVRVSYPNLPVIITTSHGSEQTAMEAIRGGAAGYVPKSRIKQELAEVVESVLSSSVGRTNKDDMLRYLTSQQLQIRLPGNDKKLIPSTVQHLQQLAGSIGLTDSIDNVHFGVALEETLVNAMVHGNLEVSSSLREQDDHSYEALIELRRTELPYRDRQVTIDVVLTADEGRFTVRDEGPGFDVNSLPDPTDPENLLKASGRGLLLVNAFMDCVTFNDAGNEICIVKRRRQAEAETRGLDASCSNTAE